MQQILATIAAADAALKDAVDANPVFLPTREKHDALLAAMKLRAEIAELTLRLIAAAGDVAEQVGAPDVGTWLAVQPPPPRPRPRIRRQPTTQRRLPLPPTQTDHPDQALNENPCQGRGMGAVREAYTAWADEYAALFGSVDAIHPEDQALVTGWAAGLHGRIVDVGCGPGQWTHLLHEHGCDVYGVDPVPAFIKRAQRQYPATTYRLGTAQHLDEVDGALAGILAWYSLIHTPPKELGEALDEFARCLAPGGKLLLGFCEGPRVEPFDHKVVTAYWWPLDEVAAWLADAGFAVTETVTRADPGRRPHGAAVAVRLPG